MHEYSIVASLVDRVEREAAAHGAPRVHRLEVKIGELSGVELDLLRTAFDTFTERTICDGAALDVQSVAARWACPQCMQPIACGQVLRCRACNRPARLSQGDEIILQRIEMEVA